MPMHVKRPKDVFTRFSVSIFSSVLDALTPESRKVIEKYSLGTLLDFDNCIVPHNFARWVAQLVNFRSGDIVFGGKVIPLTREYVFSLSTPYD